MGVSERSPAAKGPDCADDYRLLVLISGTGDEEYLVRNGHQFAVRQQQPWTVAWVDSGQELQPHADRRLQSALSLEKALGATTKTLHGTNLHQTVMAFLAERRIRTVMLGAENRHRGRPWRKHLYRQLIDSNLPLDVTVAQDPASSKTPGSGTWASGARHGAWRSYAVATLSVLVATALAVPLEYWVANYNLVLIYVLAVVATGLGYGSRAAIFASILAFLSFNFFMTEPRYTLEVARQDELATLVFLLLIALICGPAASRIRRQFMLLKVANRSSESMRLLDTILHESRRLEAYIQNLLDMTRLGHGTLKIERDWVPLADIIGSSISRLKRYSPDG